MPEAVDPFAFPPPARHCTPLLVNSAFAFVYSFLFIFWGSLSFPLITDGYVQGIFCGLTLLTENTFRETTTILAEYRDSRKARFLCRLFWLVV